MTDNHWGLFAIVSNDKPNGKPDKIPMDLTTGKSPVAAKSAFTYSLEEAKAKLNGGSTMLGYLPAPDSTYVGADLDKCLENDGATFKDWADDLLGDYDGPDAVTPSGQGVRIMMPRAPGDEDRGSAKERNDVGFFATEARAFTVPLELADKLDELVRDDGLVDRIVARRDAADDEARPGLYTAEQKVAHNGEFDRKWKDHWLNHLSPEDQQAAVTEMLKALPKEFCEEYSQWLEISMALHHLSVLVIWDAETIWDQWSESGAVYRAGFFRIRTGDANYNPAQNRYFWGRLQPNKGVTIFTLLHHAREHGFDIEPWRQKAEVRRRERLAEDLGELLTKTRKKQESGKPEGRIISGPDFLNYDPGALRWVVDECIPPGLTALAGQMKVGKSFLLIQLAEAITTGRDFLDMPTQRGRVLYYAVEDGVNRLRRRVKQMGVRFDPDRLSLVFQGSPTPTDLAKDIARDIEAVGGDVALVIIDTFKLASGTREDSRKNAYEQDVEMLAVFKMLADMSGVAILATFHERKPPPGRQRQTGDHFDAISGSAGILATADGFLRLIRERETTLGRLYIGGRDVREDRTINLDHSREDEGRWSPLSGAMNRSLDMLTRMKAGARKDILETIMLKGPMTRDELRGTLPNHTSENIQRSLHRLLEGGVIVEDEDGNLHLAMGE
ncbi:AAA family ATPase [Tropicimonas sediminicola]|uniref:Primase C terminal 2 (PriCT-2) n=1 Tax=Tropicimonas sediminicola TaxID=1031541 RepID=A0A239FIR8_9RHOB|nr:AAA family ATPase [Tropicimonas sediminicola]SNS56846.1 Primase C terminal 2 (PriCT-2) [Tropicimonas sediminicola]